MIDTTKENLISIREARHQFPHRPSISTIWRWIPKGVKGAVLESIRIGGRRFTSVEACQRFIDATSCNNKQPKRRKPRQEQRSVANAQAILDEFGI